MLCTAVLIRTHPLFHHIYLHWMISGLSGACVVWLLTLCDLYSCVRSAWDTLWLITKFSTSLSLSCLQGICWNVVHYWWTCSVNYKTLRSRNSCYRRIRYRVLNFISSLSGSLTDGAFSLVGFENKWGGEGGIFFFLSQYYFYKIIQVGFSVLIFMMFTMII